MTPVARLLLSVLTLLAPACAHTVRVGVFGLFHPAQLVIRPAAAGAIAMNGRVLEGKQSAALQFPCEPVRISSRTGEAADISVSIPGKIERRYHGMLFVTSARRELVIVVELDREIAAASITAAEIAPGAPLEALKAQAVAARSFLAAAHGRHRGFDFCDTTHCQFLREWPLPSADAYRAVQETEGLLLTYGGRPIAARYSAACGGSTLAFDDAGYSYRAVPCPGCRAAHEPVRGHRLGLCQLGACAMAASGASFREILNHYYPGTALVHGTSIY